jgi:hypothetical protein
VIKPILYFEGLGLLFLAESADGVVVVEQLLPALFEMWVLHCLHSNIHI